MNENVNKKNDYLLEAIVLYQVLLRGRDYFAVACFIGEMKLANAVSKASGLF